MARKIFLLMLVYLLVGCSENNDVKKGAELFSIIASDCKNKEGSEKAGNVERLVVQSTGDGIYKVTHQNVLFNCCLPVGLIVEMEVRNDTIFYTEREKEAGNCRCICPYDLSAEIGNLDDGEYVLCLIKATNQLGTIKLNFKNGMYEEIPVSELKDYPYL